MHRVRPLLSRIAQSIQGRMSKSVEDNPDGALAKYLWLWQSLGRRPGQRLIPRPIGFFFAVSVDLFSLVGWYVRSGILRVVGSATSKEAIMNLARSKRVAGLTIIAGGVIGASLSISFLGSRSDDVPAPDPVVAAALTPEDRFEVETSAAFTDEERNDLAQFQLKLDIVNQCLLHHNSQNPVVESSC